jgi:hypothetical protein
MLIYLFVCLIAVIKLSLCLSTTPYKRIKGSGGEALHLDAGDLPALHSVLFTSGEKFPSGYQLWGI